MKDYRDISLIGDLKRVREEFLTARLNEWEETFELSEDGMTLQEREERIKNILVEVIEGVFNTMGM